MVLQWTESVERCAAVGTTFRGRGVPARGVAATGARRRPGRFVPVAVDARGRRFLEPGQMVVHVHLDLDVRDQRLSANDTRRRKRHLATVDGHRVAVLLEVLVELLFVVDDHLAVAAHGAGGDLDARKNKTKII